MSRKTGRGKLTFTLIATLSLDGRITRGNREGSGWTSKEDKQWLQKELARYDALIMGRKTFDTISRPLVPRNRIIFTHSQLFCCSQEHQHKQCTVAFSGDMDMLRKLLAHQRWTHVAVLGGTQIYDWFLARNLISEMYLTLEPAIFGSGKPLSAQLPNPPHRFHLLTIKQLNSRGTLLLHYKGL